MDLPRNVMAGDVLLLNDGAMVLKVIGSESARIGRLVHVCGPLAHRKRINRPDGGLSAFALTGKYREGILRAVAVDPDFTAVPFRRSAHEPEEARPLDLMAVSKPS